MGEVSKKCTKIVKNENGKWITCHSQTDPLNTVQSISRKFSNGINFVSSLRSSRRYAIDDFD